MTEVLTGFRRVFTPDLDEARERVAEVFCPHELRPAQVATDASSVRFNSAVFGAVGLSYLAYGATVRIRPQRLESFILVQIPLAGQARVRSGGEEVLSDPLRASVPDPAAIWTWSGRRATSS